MAKFASEEGIPVQVEGDPHTIYIRSEMDYDTQQSIVSVASKASVNADGVRSGQIDCLLYTSPSPRDS